MAGDWIKVESVTPNKPEVFKIADLCDIEPEHAFGSLLCIWIWADQHTEDGNAVSVTRKLVDRTAGVSGFADAMEKVGWLVIDTDGACFPNFDRHNGKTAKNRALTAKRVANHKLKSNDNSNDASVSSALPREEKRREEKEDKPAAKATAAIGISKFLENCKETGDDPIPETDPIFTYTSEAKIPDDFLHLYWLEFVERNKESGKRYKDWRSAFRNAVRGNWYKLWWLDGESYLLSTNGKQAEMKHKGSGRL
jgi:hypothetical protein